MAKVIETEEIEEKVLPTNGDDYDYDDDEEEGDDEDGNEDDDDDELDDDDDDDDTDDDYDDEDDDMEDDEGLELQPVKNTKVTSNTEISNSIKGKVDKPKPTPISTPPKQSMNPDEYAQARKLPTIPGKNITFTELETWLRSLTPTQWSHVSVYVYRVWPVINKQLVDPTSYKYIDKWSSPKSIEEIIATHGGGSYRVDVTDTDKGVGYVTRCSFDIPWNEHPPLINIKELDVNNRKNQTYITWLTATGGYEFDAQKGKLIPMPTVGEIKAVEETRATSGTVKEVIQFAEKVMAQSKGNNDDAALARSVDLVAKGAEQAMSMIKNQGSTSEILGVVDKIIGVMGNKGSETSTMLPILTAMMQMQSDNTKLMLTMMMESNKAMAEAIRASTDKIANMSNKESEDKEDEVDKIEKLVRISRMVRGGDSGGGGEWWERLITALGPAVAPLIVPLLSMNKPGGMGMPNTSSPDLSGYPQSQAMIPSNTTPNNPNPNPVSETEMLDKMIAQYLAQAGPQIVQAVGSGVTGFDFASAVDNMYGRQAWSMMANQGVTKLLTLMENNKELWTHLMAVTSKEKLSVWVTDFCQYIDTLTKMEEEGE